MYLKKKKKLIEFTEKVLFHAIRIWDDLYRDMRCSLFLSSFPGPFNLQVNRKKKQQQKAKKQQIDEVSKIESYRGASLHPSTVCACPELMAPSVQHISA